MGGWVGGGGLSVGGGGGRVGGDVTGTVCISGNGISSRPLVWLNYNCSWFLQRARDGLISRLKL